MIKGKIRLNMFKDWEIKFVIAEEIGEKSAIKYIKNINLEVDTEKELLDNLLNYKNGAVMCSNRDNFKTFIVLYYTDDLITQIQNITHEVCHTVQDITEHLYIKDDETEAYLTGYINREIIKHLI